MLERGVTVMAAVTPEGVGLDGAWTMAACFSRDGKTRSAAWGREGERRRRGTRQARPGRSGGP